jgi:hypothetical protein
MRFRSTITAAAIGLSALASPAIAAPTVYFGENLTPGQAVSGAPVTARASFLAQLSGVSTENFEGIASGTSPTSINFAGSAGNIVASFAPGSGIVTSAIGAGRFATSGINYFSVSSSFSTTFSTPIAAFGFYGTDVGDFNGSLTVTLIHSTGPNTVLTVANTVNAPDGALLFFGVIDTANPFVRINFGNTSTGVDFFGFDDITVGDIRQVTGVPESSTWMMMIAGFGIVGGAMRRRHRTSVSFG